MLSISLDNMFVVRLSKDNQPNNYIKEIVIESICPTSTIIQALKRFRLEVMEFNCFIKLYDLYPKFGDITPLVTIHFTDGRIKTITYRRLSNGLRK